jgi:dUTPase
MILFIAAEMSVYFALTGKEKSARLTPSRATVGSVGIDLVQPRDTYIEAQQIKQINLKLTVRFSPGHFGLLALRSSAGLLHLSLKGGVIGKHFDKIK